MYSSLSLIAGLAYGYSQTPVETQVVFKNIEVPYEVVRQITVKEFVSLPCNAYTKDAQ